MLELKSTEVDSIVLGNVSPDITDTPGPEIPEVTEGAVDLGLSVMWADRNLGAERPQDYGFYLGWGEFEPKDFYSDYNYYIDDDIRNIDIGGTAYDPCTILWGDSWRLPSIEECQELVDRCTWEWTTLDDVAGIKITGPNGNHIFLPAGGYCNWGGWVRIGDYDTYWTGNTSNDYESWYYRFDEYMHDVTPWDGAKYVGQLVRAVNKKPM